MYWETKRQNQSTHQKCSPKKKLTKTSKQTPKHKTHKNRNNGPRLCFPCSRAHASRAGIVGRGTASGGSGNELFLGASAGALFFLFHVLFFWWGVGKIWAFEGLSFCVGLRSFDFYVTSLGFYYIGFLLWYVGCRSLGKPLGNSGVVKPWGVFFCLVKAVGPDWRSVFRSIVYSQSKVSGGTLWLLVAKVQLDRVPCLIMFDT